MPAGTHADACALVTRGGRVRDLSRHVLGLFNGLPGARRWRRTLSDASLLAANDWRLIERAAGEIRMAQAGLSTSGVAAKDDPTARSRAA